MKPDFEKEKPIGWKGNLVVYLWMGVIIIGFLLASLFLGQCTLNLFI